MIKKVLSTLLSGIMVVGLYTGCSNSNSDYDVLSKKLEQLENENKELKEGKDSNKEKDDKNEVNANSIIKKIAKGLERSLGKCYKVEPDGEERVNVTYTYCPEGTLLDFYNDSDKRNSIVDFYLAISKEVNSRRDEAIEISKSIYDDYGKDIDVSLAIYINSDLFFTVDSNGKIYEDGELAEIPFDYDKYSVSNPWYTNVKFWNNLSENLDNETEEIIEEFLNNKEQIEEYEYEDEDDEEIIEEEEDNNYDTVINKEDVVIDNVCFSVDENQENYTFEGYIYNNSNVDIKYVDGYFTLIKIINRNSFQVITDVWIDVQNLPANEYRQFTVILHQKDFDIELGDIDSLNYDPNCFEVQTLKVK